MQTNKQGQNLNNNIKNGIRTILAIDTSCDDTSVAVLEDRQVLSNIISSQIDLHKEWGGVVPGLARREHEKRIDGCVEQALKSAGKDIEEVDAIAVTKGPGLAIALEVGIRKAKELALANNKPLIPINHMEGHLLSSFAIPSITKDLHGTAKNDLARSSKTDELSLESIFPAIGILVSGGHTEIVLASGIGEYKIIGQTLDDAIGESFDKVAKLLALGYPGGPIVSKLAMNGDASRFNLPIAMKNDPSLNISYSGLKTAVLYLVRDLKGESRVQERKKSVSWSANMQDNEKLRQGNKLVQTDNSTNMRELDDQTIADICASFQEAAIETLLAKVRKALKIYSVKSIICGGGVINNSVLREKIRKLAVQENKQIFIPQAGDLFMDNAAMIAIAAYMRLHYSDFEVLNGPDEINELDRDPGLKLGAI